MVIPVIDDVQPKDGVESNSGQELRFTYPVVSKDLIDEYNFRSGTLGALGPSADPARVIFLGYVLYMDNLDRQHRTGFLRQYDPRTMRFHRSDDPDYEYQD